MKLSKVEYEFFEDFEEASIDATVLNRQVRLHFSDAPTLFISWTWERQYDESCSNYSIGFSTESYLTDTAPVVVDASTSPFWRDLIGHEVELTFVDDDFQVLKITSGGNAVFCSSLDLDVVRISSESPL